MTPRLPHERLTLSFACGPYDRMEALYNGTVVAEGVDLVPKIIQRPLDIFSRMLKSDEFDVAEMSLTHCFVLRAKNTARFVTLPIFPSRMFRHGFIFVNRKSGIRTPAELAGRRIGVQGYQMTAAVWIRGHLRSDYEVNLDGVEWFEGGVNIPGVAGGDATSFRPLQPLKIRSIGMDDTLSAMLARGDIDALFGADVPDSLGSGDVVRLFSDFHAVERAYYQRTAIFPIMHALVIRQELYHRHPWLGGALLRACNAAKAAAQAGAKYTASLRFMLPWLLDHLTELEEVFGPDPWPYGLDANRKTLESFARFLADDGFLGKPPLLEDTFIPVHENA
jgi:4,5-dihydroxyphthalate decarboxylase